MSKKLAKHDSFSNNDFNSNNGMSTTIWGPIIWSGLHITSFNYPVNPTASDKKNYKTWFLSYKNILPCVYCRGNFEKNLKSSKFNNAVFDSSPKKAAQAYMESFKQHHPLLAPALCTGVGSNLQAADGRMMLLVRY